MSVLLAWFAWDAQEPDADAWRQLQACARARADGSIDQVQAPGVRAMTISTRALAPPALHRLASGRLLLTDIERPTLPMELEDLPQDSAAAVIFLDPLARRVRLLRDRLGQRPLLWARVPGGLLIASGEHILRAHPAIGSELDPDYLASYFGATAPPESATVFRAIRSVAPGEALELDATGERSTRLRAEPLAAAFGWSDQRAIDEYAQHLVAAVQATTVGAQRLGVSLSGGLDSSSVAMLLARSAGQRQPALAITYGCDGIVDLDERPFAAALAQSIGLEHWSFAADDKGPLSAGYPPEVCGDTPICNPYRSLKAHSYAHFRQSGVDVVLTGNFGDHLSCEPRFWLADALRAGRVGLIARSYTQMLASVGLRGPWRDPGWRALLRPAAARRPSVAPWLTPRAAARLRGNPSGRFDAWPRPAQAAHCLGSYAAIDAAGECYFAQRHGLEVRHPYRDWPLVRLALSLPGYQSWRGGQAKSLARAALAGHLPDAWRLQPKRASMQPLFENAILYRGRPRLEALIEFGRPVWLDYVSAAAVDACLRAAHRSDFQCALLWLLAGFGMWLETIV